MSLPRSTFGVRLILGILLGAVVVVAFSLFADLQQLSRHLRSFRYPVLVPVLGLTLLNYLLRFVKWHLLLRRTGIGIPIGHSAIVFLSGFAMGITPGKLGEILKGYLLKLSHGFPLSQTTPVVIAERVADLLALILLSLLGLFTFATGPRIRGLLLASAVVVVALTALLSHRPTFGWLVRTLAARPRTQRFAPRLERFSGHLADVFVPLPLLWNTALSVAAWLCECVGFYLVIHGLSDARVSLQLAVFVYSSTTILGALSFLPGGLGVTEGGMTLLLVRLADGLARAGAVAATLMIRLCTLWFGVFIGLVALTVFRVQAGRALDLSSLERPKDG